MDNFTSISFLSLAVVLLLLERLTGLRRTAAPIEHRWVTNLGLMLLGSIVVSILFPISVTQVAGELESGLVHDLALPLPLEAALVFLVLDCWRYWEHRVFHEVPLLWRAHLVHHSDTAIDVTTAERHHPLEQVFTAFIAFIVVFALGFSIQALGLYLLVAKLSSLYTHANITLPESADRQLRRWLVTPAAHAVHHSSYQPETDSNYGSVLTIWDRLFGTYTDPATARVPRFGLTYFRQPLDTDLISVLVQPFESPRTGPPTEHQGETPEISGQNSATLSPQWRQAFRYGGIGLLLALLALWPTAFDLALLWSRSESYQYAWLVLPMFIYVVGWYHRDSILAMTPRPGYSGLPVIVAAAVLWTAAFVIDIKLGQHIALVLALQGIALCSLGWVTYRKLLPIMLLLFLMIPCGDIMQPLLQGLTVKWIEWLAILMGLPHSIEGYLVHIGEHDYIVLEACSGLGVFTLAGFLGYSFGLLLFRSLAKVVAMAALGATLGILTNALRVCLIVAVDWLNGTQMDLAGHADIHWLVLLSSLGVLFYLASRLDHDTWPAVTDATNTTVAPSWPAARFAPILAGVALLVTVGLVQGLAYRTGVNSTTTDSLQRVAYLYPGSHWATGINENKQILTIPYKQNLDAVLIAVGGSSGRMGEQTLHPENRDVWLHTHTGHYQDCLSDNCIRFVHSTWKQSVTDEFRHVFYAYYVGNLVTDSKLTFRLASGWNRVAGSPGASGLIGFKLHGDFPPELSLSGVFQEIKNNLRATPNGGIVSRTDEGGDIELASIRP